MVLTWVYSGRPVSPITRCPRIERQLAHAHIECVPCHLPVAAIPLVAAAAGRFESSVYSRSFIVNNNNNTDKLRKMNTSSNIIRQSETVVNFFVNFFCVCACYSDVLSTQRSQTASFFPPSCEWRHWRPQRIVENLTLSRVQNKMLNRSQTNTLVGRVS